MDKITCEYNIAFSIYCYYTIKVGQVNFLKLLS